jgi:hypothetical protein
MSFDDVKRCVAPVQCPFDEVKSGAAGAYPEDCV